MRATLQLAGSGGALPPLRHPVETCLEVIDAAVDEAEQARCWSLSDAELIELLGAAQRACSRIEELRLRLVSEVDRRDTGKAVPATSTAAFLTACQRTSRRMAGRDVRLAADLDHSFEQVRSALGAGRVNLEQAQVICLSLRALPPDATAEQRDATEAHLNELAAVYGPEQLSDPRSRAAVGSSAAGSAW